MKTFISWSGQRSRSIATALKMWLPDVIQQVDVWMSEHDLDAGSRWGHELTKVLEESHFGIVCLTPENQDAPWLLFEVGCLAKTTKIARVIPYLYGLSPADVRYPLAQFQGVSATKAGTFKLLQSINEAGQLSIAGERLEKSFEKWWPDLEKTLAGVGDIPQKNLPSRPDREILEEILGVLRNQSRTYTSPIIEQLEPAVVIIDTSKFFASGKAIAISYGTDRSVSTFLDDIFFALNRIGEVPAYEYGTVWLLQDQLSGRQYDDIGIEYCRTHGRVRDDRTILGVGIRAGDRLEVIRAPALQDEQNTLSRGGKTNRSSMETIDK
ncbi:MAG: TIR domain-containing protein [Anaerolineales bacterium]